MFDKSGALQFGRFLDLVDDPTKAKTMLSGLIEAAERADKAKVEAQAELVKLTGLRAEIQQVTGANSRRAAVLDRREKDMEIREAALKVAEDNLKRSMDEHDKAEQALGKRGSDLETHAIQIDEREKAAAKKLAEAHEIRQEANAKIANLKSQLA